MFLTVLYRTIVALNVPLEGGVHGNIVACSQSTHNSSALWLSGYSDRLEIYFLREQEFESLRRRFLFCSCEQNSKYILALGMRMK